MKFQPAFSRNEYARMTTRELREAFVFEALFCSGESRLLYWETDRTIVGGVMPAESALKLEADKELASDFFCQRRELGVLNLGGRGQVTVDGSVFESGRLDCLYVGRGSRDILFQSADPADPAKFFLMSYPAHAVHPTALAKQSDARQVKLGSQETANQRTIFQYVHEGGLKSCQLVMGITRLESGSVWNTMPPHTHLRRSEVYLYFDVPEDAAVFHFMGPSDETRNILMHDGQAVLSPVWSIHAGCGTQNYSFVWAMGGENQRFDDMDAIAVRNLR
jgi:4-deoxy-L-threo-5-hexosulose-uronate ketol-isomerase